MKYFNEIFSFDNFILFRLRSNSFKSFNVMHFIFTKTEFLSLIRFSPPKMVTSLLSVLLIVLITLHNIRSYHYNLLNSNQPKYNIFMQKQQQNILLYQNTLHIEHTRPLDTVRSRYPLHHQTRRSHNHRHHRYYHHLQFNSVNMNWAYNK